MVVTKAANEVTAPNAGRALRFQSDCCWLEFAHGAASSNAYQEMVQLQELAVKPFGPFGDYALLEQIDQDSCFLWGYCSFLPSLNELRLMTSFSELGRLLAVDSP